jgi:hypothetical protein
VQEVACGGRWIRELVATGGRSLIVRVVVMAMAGWNGLGFSKIKAAPVPCARRGTPKLSKHHRDCDEHDQLRANHCSHRSEHTTISQAV